MKTINTKDNLTFKEAIKNSSERKAVFYSGIAGIVCDENENCKPIFFGQFDLKVSDIQRYYPRCIKNWKPYEPIDD